MMRGAAQLNRESVWISAGSALLSVLAWGLPGNDGVVMADVH
jgi:hypothetical protein